MIKTNGDVKVIGTRCEELRHEIDAEERKIVANVIRMLKSVDPDVIERKDIMSHYAECFNLIRNAGRELGKLASIDTFMFSLCDNYSKTYNFEKEIDYIKSGVYDM